MIASIVNYSVDSINVEFTPPKFNSSPLKNDGKGRLITFFLGPGIFSGLFACIEFGWILAQIKSLQRSPFQSSPPFATEEAPPDTGAMGVFLWFGLF